jgi:hypothetical protein
MSGPDDVDLDPGQRLAFRALLGNVGDAPLERGYGAVLTAARS